MSAPTLTFAKLRELLSYNRETGVFTWRVRPVAYQRWNCRYAMKDAGSDWTPPNSTTAYRVIRIFDWPFYAHRLAWLYMTGEWPTHSIDHKDRNGLNNRWDNLRAATQSQNSMNTKVPVTSKTGIKGVSFHKRAGKYRAYIRRDGKPTHLGLFDTIEEAAAARRAAALDIHGPEFGSYG